MKTALVLGASLVALAQFAAASLAGYGRYPCTGTDIKTGKRVANQALCWSQAQGKVLGQCVLEPVYGNYFCGIAGANCYPDLPCDGGACVNAKCVGGLGQKEQAPGVCLGSLAFGVGGVCGASSSDCSGGGSSPRNDLCVSGFCNPDNLYCGAASQQEGTGCYNGACNAGYYCVPVSNTCSKVVTDVGGSCFYGGPAACGTSPTAGPLFCQQSTGTCEAKLPLGAKCQADDNCSGSLFCGKSSGKCARFATTSGASCVDDPLRQCGASGTLVPQVYQTPDHSGHCYCIGSGGVVSQYVPTPNVWSLTTIGASCGGSSDDACGYDAQSGWMMYCSTKTPHTCLLHTLVDGGSCDADPGAQCGWEQGGPTLYTILSTGADGKPKCTCSTTPPSS